MADNYLADRPSETPAPASYRRNCNLEKHSSCQLATASLGRLRLFVIASMWGFGWESVVVGSDVA